MTTGKRAFTNQKFLELMPTWKELGATEFRRAVCEATMAQFGLTGSQASAHYNVALKMAKERYPAQVEGLGRAEDKKGGRHRKEPVPITVNMADFGTPVTTY